MERRTGIQSLLITFTLCLSGLASAEKDTKKSLRVLAVGKDTHRVVVRHSQIGPTSTLMFYTFAEQAAVLRLEVGNNDKTFPMSATFYLFDDDVTEQGMKRWINNQHSDGLYPNVPKPTLTHSATKRIAKVTSHQSKGRNKDTPFSLEEFAAKFKVEDYSDKKSFKLKGFTGETRVYLIPK